MKIKKITKNLSNHSFHRRFSHIYVEESVLDCIKTKEILLKLPNSKVILVSNYKEIFNPSFQDFQEQKKSMKLILAKKQDNLLYKGSELAPNFGYKNFYYNILAQNCIFNCAYCYLQGMYASGNIVVYVNTEDFFQAVEEKLKKEKLIYLCLSYETDILGLENLLKYSLEWINFASLHKNLIIEIRTKSAFFKSIAHIKPSDNVILAWSISPNLITREHEILTPSFYTRLNNIKHAILNGWKVRICIDPILYVENWKNHYLDMISKIFTEIKGSDIFDITIGTFRMNKDYLKNAKKRRNSYLLNFPFKNKNGVYTYSTEIQQELIETIKGELERYVSKDKIFTC